MAGTMANIESVEDEEREKASGERTRRRREPPAYTQYGILRVEGVDTATRGYGRALVRRAKCSGRVPITFIIFSHRGSAIDVARNVAS